MADLARAPAHNKTEHEPASVPVLCHRIGHRILSSNFVFVARVRVEETILIFPIFVFTSTNHDHDHGNSGLFQQAPTPPGAWPSCGGRSSCILSIGPQTSNGYQIRTGALSCPYRSG